MVLPSGPVGGRRRRARRDAPPDAGATPPGVSRHTPSEFTLDEGEILTAKCLRLQPASAFFYGLASVHAGTRGRRGPAVESLSLKLLARLVRRPLWTAASWRRRRLRPACRALGRGPLTLVQPSSPAGPLRPGAAALWSASVSGADGSARSLSHGPRVLLSVSSPAEVSSTCLPSVDHRGGSVGAATSCSSLGKEGRSPLKPVLLGVRWVTFAVTTPSSAHGGPSSEPGHRGGVDVVPLRAHRRRLAGAAPVQSAFQAGFPSPCPFPPSRRSSRSPAAPWVCSCSPKRVRSDPLSLVLELVAAA